MALNKDTVSGDWKILKGKIKTAWGKLSDTDIDSLAGDITQLEGKIQKTYGLTKEEASKKFNEFKKSLSSSSRGPTEDQRNPRSRDSKH